MYQTNLLPQSLDKMSEILTAVTMKITIFWYMTPCGLAEVGPNQKMSKLYETDWREG
jgi:hypothetical protein